MIYSVKIGPDFIKETETVWCDEYEGERPKYPLLTIDRESYVIDAMVENSDEAYPFTGKLVHNLQIGRYCSLANGIHFLIGRGKNYYRVTTSAAKVFQSIDGVHSKHHEKGSVIIENDVWIGRNASIMSGVIIHNGAVVAANSHVVKDVPPYAIVGGNPAKVMGYRFSEEIIKKLLTIQWWYWENDKIEQNAEYFGDDIERFCNRFYNEAKNEVEAVRAQAQADKKDRYLMLLDYLDNYPVTADVLDEFLMKNKADAQKELILFLLESDKEADMEMFLEMQSLINDTGQKVKCSLKLEWGSMDRVKTFLPNINHLIINRKKENVRLMCEAEV